MNKWIKRAAVGVGVVAALAALLVLGARVVSARKFAATYPVRDLPVPAMPQDEASLAEGARLYAARGCAECHAPDGGGKATIDDPALGRILGSNLTRGRGGIGSQRADADLVRAVKHCVKPDGTSLVFMPCDESRLIPDDELGRILAYVRSLPPVDREIVPEQLSLFGHVLNAFDVLPLVAAARIDFDAPVPPPPAAGPTAAYGERLAQIQCVGCHGEGMSGGRIPGAPPSLPVPTNITMDSTTGIGRWNRQQFGQLLRSGKRPDGTDVNPFMPWGTYKHLTDQELDALWAYLQTRPAKPFGNR